MIIELPENYSLTRRENNQIAYVEEGELYLTNAVPFKKLMKELTYAMHGRNYCYYCGSWVKHEKITMDHIIPQDIGGPTITNNLIPACSECNVRKGNKTDEQYENYLLMVEELNKGSLAFEEQYKKPLQKEIERLKRDPTFSILGDWVTIENLENILKTIDNITSDESNGPEKVKGKKYEKMLKYYQTYGRLQKPIILDKNGRLLGGYASLMVAIDEKIQTIAVIRLENVEIIF